MIAPSSGHERPETEWGHEHRALGLDWDGSPIQESTQGESNIPSNTATAAGGNDVVTPNYGMGSGTFGGQTTGMGLTWDPDAMQYTGGPVGSALAGTIIPSMSAAQQFGVAAQGAVPGYWENPLLSRAMEAQYQPAYGQYLSQYGGLGGAGEPTQTFANWAAAPEYGNIGGGGFSQAGAATRAAPTNWADIINVARGMSPTATGTLADQAARDRWMPILEDPGQAAALTALATQNVAGPGIYGRVRQAGLDRLQRQFAASNPGATPADWLGYISGREGIVGTPYYVV